MTLAQVRQALRQHRLERGMTYTQLAAEIGSSRVTYVTVKRFIEGTTDPYETTEHAIRSYLERIAQKRSA